MNSQPNGVRSLLGSRLVLLVLFAGAGLVGIVDANPAAPWGAWLSGSGLIALGVNGFLSPIPLGKPLGSVLQSMRDTAIGPEPLRQAVIWLALGLLTAGLLVRAAVYLR